MNYLLRQNVTNQGAWSAFSPNIYLGWSTHLINIHRRNKNINLKSSQCQSLCPSYSCHSCAFKVKLNCISVSTPSDLGCQTWNWHERYEWSLICRTYLSANHFGLSLSHVKHGKLQCNVFLTVDIQRLGSNNQLEILKSKKIGKSQGKYVKHHTLPLWKPQVSQEFKFSNVGVPCSL